MSETAKILPKGDPRRNAIATQLKEVRVIERAGLYKTERTGGEYIGDLLGVQYLFNYVRTLGTSNTILDVGSGTTNGIYDLAISSFGEGLQFEATVINRISFLVSLNLGNDRTHTTSVEVLNGIPDTSMGGVLGVSSVGYSDEPSLAVGSINRVLVPGGAFKGTFLKSNISGDQNMYGLKTYAAFKEAFEALGYDVDTENSIKEDILLAIKPGGTTEVTANELLQKDKETAKSQQIILGDEMESKGRV